MRIVKYVSLGVLAAAASAVLLFNMAADRQSSNFGLVTPAMAKDVYNTACGCPPKMRDCLKKVITDPRNYNVPKCFSDFKNCCHNCPPRKKCRRQCRRGKKRARKMCRRIFKDPAQATNKTNCLNERRALKCRDLCKDLPRK